MVSYWCGRISGLAGKIVLTADSTLMSDYRRNEFIGFGTCAPSNFVPDFLYRWLFFPPIRAEAGLATAAPYGLRKIEAKLLSEGFEVSTVPPEHLEGHMDGAEVLGIHVMDPFGLGPASSTMAAIFKKEPFLAQYFRRLLASGEVRKAKRNGLKIIVGGPGVWQFRYRPAFVEKYGVDCVIEGEAERVVGKIFRAALEGGDLPAHYEVGLGETPGLEEIQDIRGPSINGLVEIGRGCCRGCRFCSVTLRPLRWYPVDKILREIAVNVAAGIGWSCLHMEDVMLYGSANTLPDDEKLLGMISAVVNNSESTTWSHCSLAAVAAKPKLFGKVAETIRQKQSWWGAEVGIETGSPELAKKIMPAKAHPFKPEEWPDVVRAGMGLMHDNCLVPACTLIVGVPEETEADLLRTMELLDDLKDVRSLIVPLFFVPMGRLKDEDWFKGRGMTPLHTEVLLRCLRHDFYWIDGLIDLVFTGKWQGEVLRPFYRLFASLVKLKARQSGILV